MGCLWLVYSDKRKYIFLSVDSFKEKQIKIGRFIQTLNGLVNDQQMQFLTWLSEIVWAFQNTQLSGTYNIDLQSYKPK